MDRKSTAALKGLLGLLVVVLLYTVSSTGTSSRIA